MMELQTFIRRMNKLGYKLQLNFNFPWIYLQSINGEIVKEHQFSEHGWTIAISPFNSEKVNFINLKNTLKLIRKYGKEKRIT